MTRKSLYAAAHPSVLWILLVLMPGLALAQTETLQGDLDKSGVIDSVDEVILRNYLAGNLSAIPAQAGQLFSTDPIVGHMRYVPAGTFVQGSPAEEPCRSASESQFTHTLTYNLAVMEIEVTRQMWTDLRAVQSDLPADPSASFPDGGMNHPAQQVTWQMAVLFANLLSQQAGLRACYYSDAELNYPIDEDDYNGSTFYCDWEANGYRLPSNGEWEYFCRAGTTTTFWINESNYTSANCDSPFVPGEYPQLNTTAWYNGSRTHTGTTVAGSKAANPWNLRDVYGNVGEWCWDLHAYNPTYALTDYHGPAGQAGDRVYRNGGWDNEAFYLRSAARRGYPKNSTLNSIGFRLVRIVN